MNWKYFFLESESESHLPRQHLHLNIALLAPIGCTLPHLKSRDSTFLLSGLYIANYWVAVCLWECTIQAWFSMHQGFPPDSMSLFFLFTISPPSKQPFDWESRCRPTSWVAGLTPPLPESGQIVNRSWHHNIYGTLFLVFLSLCLCLFVILSFWFRLTPPVASWLESCSSGL